MTDDTTDDGSEERTDQTLYETHDEFLDSVLETTEFIKHDVAPDESDIDPDTEGFERVTGFVVAMTGVNADGTFGVRSASHVSPELNTKESISTFYRLNEELVDLGIDIGFRDALAESESSGFDMSNASFVPIDPSTLFGAPDHGMGEPDEPDGHGVY